MTDSDALTIARWCWPDRQWDDQGDIGVMEHTGRRDGTGALIGTGNWFDPAEEQAECSAAERVLIERGYDSHYAMLLAADVLCVDVRVNHEPFGRRRYEVLPKLNCRDLARLATAPLDARVRAMAAVIRTQEKTTTRSNAERTGASAGTPKLKSYPNEAKRGQAMSDEKRIPFEVSPQNLDEQRDFLESVGCVSDRAAQAALPILLSGKIDLACPEGAEWKVAEVTDEHFLDDVPHVSRRLEDVPMRRRIILELVQGPKE